MKKLVIILFVGVYSVAVFGAGTLSYDCCVKSAPVMAAIPVADNNDNNSCNSTHSNDVYQNHHVAAPVHHFTCRKFYGPQYAYLPAFAMTEHDQYPRLVSTAIHTAPPSLAIPVYILHCVYRI